MIYVFPSLTILLLFATLIAYEYIKSLQRDLKDARSERDTYGKLYKNTSRELAVLRGQHVPSEQFFPPTKASNRDGDALNPIVPVGEAGPSRINARDDVRRAKAAVDREPRFAHPGVLLNRQPGDDAISAAARAAMDEEREH